MSLLTLKGDFTLSGSSADDMVELITMFLSGLTERSRYAVTLREADRRGQTTILVFLMQPQLNDLTGQLCSSLSAFLYR